MAVRVTCPTCRKSVSVRANGTLRHHTNDGAPRHGSRFAPVCTYAGQPAPPALLNAARELEARQVADATPVPAQDEDTWDAMVTAAAGRVDYRLTYAAAPTSRQVHSFGLGGPTIPDAYNPDKPSSGDWDDADFSQTVTTPQAAFDRWFDCAVHEAVHEALEWFRVDGQVYLDPHGVHENAIHDLCSDFVDKLHQLRAQTTPPRRTR